MRGIRLSSRRQMRGMDIHVRRGVIHAADGGGSRIVAVTDGVWGQGVIGRTSSSSSSSSREITGRRRSVPVVVEGGNRTGQTGTRAGGVGGRHGRVWIMGTIGGAGEGGLGGRWQAEGREFVTGQQGPFGGVVVVPRDFSRTSGMDLRDRWELQLFGWTKNRLERSRRRIAGVGLESVPTRDQKL